MAATLLLVLAVVSTGLYAGFMLIFQTGIMPALARLSDDQFVPAMRRINEDVPRAVFMVVFLGVVAFPAAALAVPVEGRSDTQKWLIVAALVCAVANHLVTIAGNIPLNNALASSEQAPDSEVRAAFERPWNRFHAIRTVLILAAFVLLAFAAVG
ncbi:anthrone oxygenase family protein [Streptomyces sp. NPDC000410]|uniref:anthrone oxygenase family protein n=1 Tax=Streptomyces sp. NPDC000410 TaxID=3154254 RepID=UPI003325CB7B